MSAGEIAAFIASIVAIGIAVIAIWLSIIFYKMTTNLSISIRDSAKDIGASVERLETLFSRLYTDTFTIMKDAVTDMRKHAWPEKKETDDIINQEVEKKADEKVKVLKNNVDEELTKLLMKQSKTDAKINSMKDELEKMVNSVIDQSRNVEIDARKETLRGIIVTEAKSLYGNNKRKFKAKTLLNKVEKTYPATKLENFLSEMEKLKTDNILYWEDGELEPSTLISIKS